MNTKHLGSKLLFYFMILVLIGYAAIIFKINDNSKVLYTNQIKLQEENIWFLKRKNLGTQEDQNNLVLDDLIGANIMQYLSTVKSHPFMGRVNRDASVTFNRYGPHFIIGSKVNGVPVAFLLDTGATKVSLTKKDARSLGINPKKLQYNVKVQTAKGISFVSSVKLNSIQIGNIIVRNVNASVGDVGPVSLLGMSLLNRFSKYEIKRDGAITFWR